MATIFTRIINGEIPCYKVAENDKFYAFLDIKPLKRGHTLVIPKMEVDYFFDLDDETMGEMMVFAKRIAQRIKKVTGCKKVAVLVAGLEVPHAHIHLIPINKEGDTDSVNERLHLSDAEFRSIAASISDISE